MGNAKLCNKIHLFYIYYIKLSFKNHNITQKSFCRKKYCLPFFPILDSLKANSIGLEGLVNGIGFSL